jgi:hypothetical protein
MVWDSKTFALTTGSFYDIIEDGHGNVTYMYRGPAFTTEEAYREWPHFHDIDTAAHQCYEFFKKALSRFGDGQSVVVDIDGTVEGVGADFQSQVTHAGGHGDGAEIGAELGFEGVAEENMPVQVLPLR